METNALIAIVIVVALVVGINGGLYLMIRRGKNNQHIQMWQRAARKARNPWQEEEEQLQELSKLVDQLKNNPEEDEKTGDSASS